MGNKKLNRIKNIDIRTIREIDKDALGEALLVFAPNSKQACRNIDIRISHMSTMAHIPYVTAGEQFDRILEGMIIKSQIIHLYDLFVTWYKGLHYKKKKVYIAYFRKNYKKSPESIVAEIEAITHTTYRKDRVITPMIRSFMCYLLANAKFETEDIITNPYIYGVYKDVLRRNKATKDGVKKRRNKHDNSTNERCHCCCVRH